MALSIKQQIAELENRRDVVLKKLGDYTANNLDFPDTGDAVGVRYEAHKRGLYAELREIERTISLLEGGFTIPSEITT